MGVDVAEKIQSTASLHRGWTIPVRAASVRRAPPASERTDQVPPGHGHDFGAVPVRAPHTAGSGAAFPTMVGPCPVPAGPRACPFGGACHTCPTQVQAKPAVGEPDDTYEQEADRVADQVMRMSDPAVPTSRQTPGVVTDPQRTGAPAQAPPTVMEVLRSPGEPLDPATGSFMEARFGRDFSVVRVHTGTKAAESARAVNALAYSVGHDIVFGAGTYDPGSPSTKRLLAHELTHVTQQQAGAAPTVRRRVRAENVTCNQTGLTNPDLSGPEAVAAIEAADAEAITLALRAELMLDIELLAARGGLPVDPDFDTILQEELGLTLTNPAHFGLVAQQRNRFRRVRETLESGYLRYMCRGGSVSLVGCTQGTCADAYAFTCPANRLIVLCQPFWDEPGERAATVLHEPFHIWFDMARHATNALRRADASCFESFARRLAGETNVPSCVDHTAG